MTETNEAAGPVCWIPATEDEPVDEDLALHEMPVGVGPEEAAGRYVEQYYGNVSSSEIPDEVFVSVRATNGMTIPMIVSVQRQVVFIARRAQ